MAAQKPPGPSSVKAEPMDATPASPVLGGKVKKEEDDSSSSDASLNEEAPAQEEENSEAIPEQEEQVSQDDPEDEASNAAELAAADELAAMEAKARRASVREDDRELAVTQILPDRMRKRRHETIERIKQQEAAIKQALPDDEEEDYVPEDGDEESSGSSSHASEIYKQEEESEQQEVEEEEEEEEEDAPADAAASSSSSSSSTAEEQQKPKVKKEQPAVKKPRTEADRLAESVQDVLGGTVRKAATESSKAATATPASTKVKSTAATKPKAKAAKPKAAAKPAADKKRQELEQHLKAGMRLVALHELTTKPAVSYLAKLCAQSATVDAGQEAQDRAAFWTCFYRDRRDAYRGTKSNTLDQLAHTYLQRLRETSDNQVLRDLVEVALQPASQLEKRALPDTCDTKLCQLDGRSPAMFQVQLKGKYPQSDKDFCSEPQVSGTGWMRLLCVHFAAHVCEKFKSAIGDYLEKELELPRDTTDLAHVEGFLKSKQAERFYKQWFTTYQELLNA